MSKQFRKPHCCTIVGEPGPCKKLQTVVLESTAYVLSGADIDPMAGVCWATFEEAENHGGRLQFVVRTTRAAIAGIRDKALPGAELNRWLRENEIL